MNTNKYLFQTKNFATIAAYEGDNFIISGTTGAGISADDIGFWI